MLDTRLSFKQAYARGLTLEGFVKLVQFVGVTKAHSLKFRTYLKSSAQHKGILHIEEVRELKSEVAQYEVLSSLLTLFGPKGVMPSHYTEHIIRGIKDGDSTLLEFSDIFYNKLMQFLCLVVKRKDVSLNLIKYILAGGGKPPSLIRRIWSVVGVASWHTGQSYPYAMLRCAGSVVISRPACVLQAILKSFFRFPVHIQQFVVTKVPVKSSQITKLGAANSTLEDAFYLGQNAYLSQNKISICINDVPAKLYHSILKKMADGSLHLILEHYLGKNTKYEVLVEVERSARITKLSGFQPAVLGRTVWCTRNGPIPEES